MRFSQASPHDRDRIVHTRCRNRGGDELGESFATSSIRCRDEKNLVWGIASDPDGRLDLGEMEIFCLGRLVWRHVLDDRHTATHWISISQSREQHALRRFGVNHLVTNTKSTFRMSHPDQREADSRSSSATASPTAEASAKCCYAWPNFAKLKRTNIFRVL